MNVSPWPVVEAYEYVGAADDVWVNTPFTDGAILGFMNLAAVGNNPLRVEARSFGNFTNGRWTLWPQAPNLLPEPIPFRGTLQVRPIDQTTDFVVLVAHA